MKRPSPLRRLVDASKLPHSTIRTRIALVYGGVFLVLGTALLATVNLASRAGTETEARSIASSAAVAQPGYAVNGPLISRRHLGPPTVYDLTDNVSNAAGQQLLYWSIAALLVMTGCAVAVGWWTAGRVLRPIHDMTEKARRLSAHTLHERMAPTGPDDELKELGETLDALLARLEKAFDSQQRFIANASHELRTPLATQRAAIQIGLDDPSPEDLVRTRQTLLDTNRRSERLIEGLLLLAVSDEGLRRRERVALDETTAAVADALAAEARERSITVEVTARPVTVEGDAVLLDHLVHNLVANALRHNHPGGTVRVRVGPEGLEVANTGPVVDPATVPLLFEPFRRARARRHAPGEGAGLGLSIVASVARAHGGVAGASANPGGGLTARVTLPTGPPRTCPPGAPVSGGRRSGPGTPS
ncbi:sensor histidine kinase [Streptomyces anulatus]|uniref:sensor histidine kinase n=1 Tax=Streptomyces anulatus TaxID=1892 RepID=UPI003658785A